MATFAKHSVGIIYDDIQEMISDPKLKPDMVVEALGYYEKEDSPTGFFIIRKPEDVPDAVVDDGKVFRTNNGYYAIRMIFNEAVSVASYGAIGSDRSTQLTDNTEAINRCLKYNDNVIFEENKIYKVTSQLLLDRPGMTVDFNNSKIHCLCDSSNTSEAVILIDQIQKNIPIISTKSDSTVIKNIKHLYCSGNSDRDIIMIRNPVSDTYLENIDIVAYSKSAIKVLHTSNSFNDSSTADFFKTNVHIKINNVNCTRSATPETCEGHGVYASNQHNVSITNSSFLNNKYGIYIIDGENCNIDNTELRHDYYGAITDTFDTLANFAIFTNRTNINCNNSKFINYKYGIGFSFQTGNLNINVDKLQYYFKKHFSDAYPTPTYLLHRTDSSSQYFTLQSPYITISNSLYEPVPNGYSYFIDKTKYGNNIDVMENYKLSNNNFNGIIDCPLDVTLYNDMQLRSNETEKIEMSYTDINIEHSCIGDICIEPINTFENIYLPAVEKLDNIYEETVLEDSPRYVIKYKYTQWTITSTKSNTTTKSYKIIADGATYNVNCIRYTDAKDYVPTITTSDIGKYLTMSTIYSSTKPKNTDYDIIYSYAELSNVVGTSTVVINQYGTSYVSNGTLQVVSDSTLDKNFYPDSMIRLSDAKLYIPDIIVGNYIKLYETEPSIDGYGTTSSNAQIKAVRTYYNMDDYTYNGAWDGGIKNSVYNSISSETTMMPSYDAQIIEITTNGNKGAYIEFKMKDLDSKFKNISKDNLGRVINNIPMPGDTLCSTFICRGSGTNARIAVSAVIEYTISFDFIKENGEVSSTTLTKSFNIYPNKNTPTNSNVIVLPLDNYYTFSFTIDGNHSNNAGGTTVNDIFKYMKYPNAVIELSNLTYRFTQSENSSDGSDITFAVGPVSIIKLDAADVLQYYYEPLYSLRKNIYNKYTNGSNGEGGIPYGKYPAKNLTYSVNTGAGKHIIVMSLPWISDITPYYGHRVTNGRCLGGLPYDFMNEINYHIIPKRYGVSIMPKTMSVISSNKYLQILSIEKYLFNKTTTFYFDAVVEVLTNTAGIANLGTIYVTIDGIPYNGIGPFDFAYCESNFNPNNRTKKSFTVTKGVHSIKMMLKCNGPSNGQISIPIISFTRFYITESEIEEPYTTVLKYNEYTKIPIYANGAVVATPASDVDLTKYVKNPSVEIFDDIPDEYDYTTSRGKLILSCPVDTASFTEYQKNIIYPTSIYVTSYEDPSKQVDEAIKLELTKNTSTHLYSIIKPDCATEREVRYSLLDGNDIIELDPITGEIVSKNNNVGKATIQVNTYPDSYMGVSDTVHIDVQKFIKSFKCGYKRSDGTYFYTSLIAENANVLTFYLSTDDANQTICISPIAYDDSVATQKFSIRNVTVSSSNGGSIDLINPPSDYGYNMTDDDKLEIPIKLNSTGIVSLSFNIYINTLKSIGYPNSEYVYEPVKGKNQGFVTDDINLLYQPLEYTISIRIKDTK